MDDAADSKKTGFKLQSLSAARKRWRLVKAKLPRIFLSPSLQV
jgi:hypothetical protein